MNPTSKGVWARQGNAAPCLEECLGNYLCNDECIRKKVGCWAALNYILVRPEIYAHRVAGVVSDMWLCIRQILHWPRSLLDWSIIRYLSMGGGFDQGPWFGEFNKREAFHSIFIISVCEVNNFKGKMLRGSLEPKQISTVANAGLRCGVGWLRACSGYSGSAPAFSPSAQVCSPAAQVKAAVAHVRKLKRN
jgi:hypothetical protein